VIDMPGVNPSASDYSGWAGECPGVQQDRLNLTEMASGEGVQVRALEGKRATRAAVRTGFRAMLKGVVPGDVLFLGYSGHGGQVRNNNPAEDPEPSGYDSTICLWDGMMLDDEIGSLLCEVPAGVLVFIVADCCHAGSMERGAPLKQDGRKPLSLRRTAARRGGDWPGLRCQVVLYAACQDAESALGSSGGGAWVNGLTDAWTSGMTYATWFPAAVKRVGSDQHPRCEVYGGPDMGRRAFRGFLGND
jgi:hypothetical protein